jgi:hypothetical protein
MIDRVTVKRIYLCLGKGLETVFREKLQTPLGHYRFGF